MGRESYSAAAGRFQNDLQPPDIEVGESRIPTVSGRLFCTSPEAFFADKDHFERLDAEIQDKLKEM